MTIKNELLNAAHKAKRMRNLFASRYAKGVVIPVISNGRTVEVPAQDIASTFNNIMEENLTEFASYLSADEVLTQAYRIANIRRQDVPRGEKYGKQLKELE